MKSKEQNKAISLFKNLLKTGSHTDDELIEVDDFEIECLFTKEDYKLDQATKDLLNELLGNAFKNHESDIQNIMGNIDMYTSVFGRIADITDFVNYVIAICNAYSVISYYKETNSEIFDILYEAADRIENAKYAQWFRNKINKYEQYAMSDNTFETWLSAFKDTFWNGAALVYDAAFSGAVKKIAYNAAAQVCGCTAGAIAFETFLISSAYNLTYACLDKFLKLSDKSDTVLIMNFIAPVEKALCREEQLYGAYLINEPTLTNAVNYDLAFRLLKETNAYLYQTAYDYCSLISDTDGMELVASNASFWKAVHCHNGNTAYIDSKYTGIHCPVDVYAYDLTGNAVLQIVNEEIVYCDDEITALVSNGKKAVVYPADKDYRIEIVPRENGNMSYFVSEIENGEISRDIAFYDLPIETDKKYTGEIPQPFAIDSEFYALTLNEEIVTCDYDSNENSCENGHSFGEWTTKTAVTTCSDGLLVRECSECKKQETQMVPAEHPNREFRDSVSATCTSVGYEGNIFCSDCGIYLGKGSETMITDHTYTNNYEAINEASHYSYCVCGEKITEPHMWLKSLKAIPASCTKDGKTITTCALCGYEKVTVIAATGHSDKDNDGFCDDCGDNLSAPQSLCSHLCHKSGFLGFIWKIINLFNKLFRINQYCECGAAHW